MRCLNLNLHLTLALSLLAQHVLPTFSNTEIINFSAGNSVPVAPLPENWTVLHAGVNEIIVRDKIPAPLSGSLCGDDDDDGEDVHPFKRRPCPYELWLALDLDGDGEDKGDREIHTAWKSYDRFTLRVSWPASHPAQVALTLHRPPAAPPPSTSAVPSAARTKRLHLVRIRLAQEGVRVPVATRQRGRVDEVEAVPLVVLLEPLVLGVLPASVLPTVVALLGVLGAIACGVLPCVFRMLRGVVHRARTELAELEKEEKKES